MYYTKGVKKIDKPSSVQIGLPPAWEKPILNVVYANGTIDSFRISKKVAEVLLAYCKNITIEG